MPAAALAVLLAGGCLPSATLRTGRPIADNQVAAIAPGTTTKAQLFDWFGAPAAILARGEVAEIPAAATLAACYSGGPSGAIDSGAWFELFPGPGEPGGSRRLYYFRHVVAVRMNYFALLGLYSTGRTTSDRLWVLVDERTGIVEDYAYRKSGANTVFGGPRPPAQR